MMHHDYVAFPETSVDFAALGLSPVGVVREDDGPWHPLAIDAQRNAYAVVAGEAVALDPAQAGPAIYAALDETCERLWGNSWNSAVGEIFRVNRRTTQRDRVSRNLLPPAVLQAIAFVACSDEAPNFAEALLAMARLSAKFGNEEGLVRRQWNAVADVYFGDASPDLEAVAAERPNWRRPRKPASD